MKLHSDRVWLPEGIQGATITVEAGRITAIAPAQTAPDDAHDLSGCLLTPALVNGHTHLPMASLRALGGVAAREGNVVEDLWFGIEARLTDADIRAFTRMGALECLLAGTGAVFEHYYGAEALAQGLADVGLAGVIAPTLQDVSGPGVDQLDAQLDATVRIHGDPKLRSAGITTMWGPHATDTVSPALWRTILDHELDLGLHLHVAQSPEEVERARAQGATPVELLDRVGALERRALLVHGLFVSDGDRRRLDPARHRLGHCPWSQCQFAFPAHLGPWLDDGFDVVVGTDAGACNDSMNVQQELRLLAVGPLYEVPGRAERYERHPGPEAADALWQARQAAFTRTRERADPERLLATVTTAAAPLAPELGLGRLEVGSLANVAAWDLTHPALWPAPDPFRALAFGDSSAALHSLVVAGRWVGEPGDVRAILRRDDVRAWRDEATARWRALCP